MYRNGQRIIYSPSDLIQFLDNEAVTWLDRYDLERPGELARDEIGEDQRIILQCGERHEASFLETLRARGRDVADIKGAAKPFVATIQAMREGREVIYQARLEAGEFGGYADFLVRVDGPSELGAWHYEVWDTKFARSLKPYYAIQLCCYAEMLDAVQRRLPEYVGVVLGNGAEQKLRTADYFWYYRAIRRAFLEQQRNFNPDQPPTFDGMADYGRWSRHVERLLAGRDDLSAIANIRASQIDKLHAVGIRSASQLASSTLDMIPRIARETFTKLRAQAAIQIASRGRDVPLYEVLPANPDNPRAGLALLPPPSPNDVVFDIEGYPLVDGGLEYLLGVVHPDGPDVVFRDWWAHDSDQEKASFESFVGWVHDRWRQDQSLHVYHYAAYETTALKRLMCRYASCEQELDELLRNNVFVDLYTVVRQGLLVGEPSYSLKNIEHLYMPARDGEVATAGDSIVYYHRWRDLRDSEDYRNSPTLRLIRDYNEADCRSTWALIEWLRRVQTKTGISWVQPTEPQQPAEDKTALATLARAMIAEIPADRSPDSEKWRVHELLAHLLEFHRREDKAAWWRYFERVAMSDQELIEDRECLGSAVRTKQSPQPVKRSYIYEYCFPEQESKLRAGSRCYFAHYEGECEILTIDYDARTFTIKKGKSNPPPDSCSLIPNEIVGAQVIASSIERTVQEYRASGRLPNALSDFLYRRPPRIADYDGGPIIAPCANVMDGTIAAVRGLDESTLCIQGPPGSGKTHTGARLVVALIKAGYKVGVTSNSHEAIGVLMKAFAEAASDIGLTYSAVKCGREGDETPHPNIEMLLGSSSLFNRAELPDLVGGTAWLFSKAEAAGLFDYLFVDEAGQVCVANLAGMAPAARNIVLLGDQMQLNQPIQGVHPGESGQSVLEYLLEEHATVPPNRGIFLPETWRMRPEICRFISDGIYESRLQPNPITSHRRIRFGSGPRHLVQREAGLVFVPVDHDGNTHECPEECDVIREIVAELTAHEFQASDGTVRKLGLDDILVVAPFNLQVRRLAAALPGVRVGTVDKFQGQQAPVVIFSVTSSDGDGSPRGIDFLFDKHRLNVAISRAQVLAVIVGSPRLERTRCSTLEQMKLVNLYCRAVGVKAEAQSA